MPDTRAIQYRRLQPDDSIADMTLMLHRAYKVLLDMGFRFWATHQTVEDTLERVGQGRCFVACRGGTIIGTITYYPPDATSGTPWYDNPSVAQFGQFAVEPALQGLGIGARLLGMAEQQARLDGAAEIALDTSEGAAHLIAYYKAKGYRFIEYTQWKMANYRSVIMSKTLSE